MPRRCCCSTSSACSSCTACSVCKAVLPLNPAGLPGVPPEVAFNTAVSFGTNTNWQAYGGETTMSAPDADAGGADGAELRLGGDRHGRAGGADPRLYARGRRDDRQLLGRPHAGTVYVLLPLSLVLALVLVSQGVVQTFSIGDGRAGTRGGGGQETGAQQILPSARGVAGRDQAARHQRGRLLQRQLGAPLREPDALSNLLECSPSC
jgi:K+-transporting ATPase ATPase A chain